MQPVFVEFSSPVPRAGGAVVTSAGARFDRDHFAVTAGGTVTVEFEVPKEGVKDELTVKVRALVSKLGPRPGYAPLELAVNSKVVVADFRIPGGGDLPQQLTFAVPTDLLRPGATNTLTLRSAPDARTQLWLYRVFAEAVWDRDAAERAWLADSVASSLLTYRTDRRAPGAEQWEPAAAWRLHIDSGEGAMPSRLDWRARSGAEASVCFALELNTFYGHIRDVDGSWYELRGTLADRRAFPGDADPATTACFTTEAGWGGRWHQGGPLTLHLATGDDSGLDRVSWTDQRACSASIGLTPNGSSFQGWSQRVNEGPVGYRGVTAVSKAEQEQRSSASAEPSTLAEDLDELGQALTNLADTAVKSLNSLFRRL
ncbi:hypothetical protein [Streptacidiphilus jiangxiensis]|uniref:OAA-family lectin sugar binding domain-containing protein n=1 Tax=Streptacidiphilus jiangxiensis TaxID=235985 RepID=A0A1H7XGR8_STRJI|nr:hypothetical protein [Streptacidiphilus jiangxiensis]SEM33092.1 hypothetical protein SAMN05414137_12419 [Streptacidiphilus jiangxiensis]